MVVQTSKDAKVELVFKNSNAEKVFQHSGSESFDLNLPLLQRADHETV